MPIERYRSAFELPRPPRVSAPELIERIAATWERAYLVEPPTPPRGVQRFRGLASANAARAERVRARVQRIRSSRRPPPG